MCWRGYIGTYTTETGGRQGRHGGDMVVNAETERGETQEGAFLLSHKRATVARA